MTPIYALMADLRAWFRARARGRTYAADDRALTTVLRERGSLRRARGGTEAERHLSDFVPNLVSCALFAVIALCAATLLGYNMALRHGCGL